MSLTIQYYACRLQDHFDGWITVVDVIIRFVIHFIKTFRHKQPATHPKKLVSIIIA
jgi:hypothetical protein